MVLIQLRSSFKWIPYILRLVATTGTQTISLLNLSFHLKFEVELFIINNLKIEKNIIKNTANLFFSFFLKKQFVAFFFRLSEETMVNSQL